MEIKNYGFVEPTITEEDYVFGSGQLGAEILQEDGETLNQNNI